MASIFEEPGFVTPNPRNINSVPSANAAQPGNGKHNWPKLAWIPLPLHLKPSDLRKRRRTRHSLLFENEVEVWARVAGKREGKNPRPQGTGLRQRLALIPGLE